MILSHLGVEIMSNVIGFVLNKKDSELIKDLEEEGMTSSDILRSSLHSYHNSIFNNDIAHVKKPPQKTILNKKTSLSSNDIKYVQHIEDELKFWKNKYNDLEIKFQNFVDDTMKKMDDTFKMMMFNKYNLNKKQIPEEIEWKNASNKIDNLLKRKLK